ncbi:hypothetical protein LTR53_009011, partial [Teratosphaeriaceae sp. CCFEE 6253]
MVHNSLRGDPDLIVGKRVRCPLLHTFAMDQHTSDSHNHDGMLHRPGPGAQHNKLLDIDGHDGGPSLYDFDGDYDLLHLHDDHLLHDLRHMDDGDVPYSRDCIPDAHIPHHGRILRHKHVPRLRHDHRRLAHHRCILCHQHGR